MAQRRAQVVRNRVGKRLQFFVRCFQLGSPFDHPLFKLFIQPVDFCLHPLAFADILYQRSDTDDLAICISEGCIEPFTSDEMSGLGQIVVDVVSAPLLVQ